MIKKLKEFWQSVFVNSIKTRVTSFVLISFLASIWSLSFFGSHSLRENTKQVLGEKQFSTVSIVANDIDSEIRLRLKTLEKVAGMISSDMIGDKNVLQAFIENRPALAMMFTAGILVYNTNGIAIADVPIEMGRIGVDYADRDFMIEALKGKSTIGKPVIGKKMHTAVFVMAVPIIDKRNDKIVGVLSGITSLSLPNFLDKITNNGYGKTGGYMLVAPQHNLFVTATDKSRIMQPLPTQGVNVMHDRYMQGFEGFGVAKSSRGVEELTAAKHISSVGWFVVIVLPTEEAFTSISVMEKQMYSMAIFITLFIGCSVWFLLSWQLSPVFETIKVLSEMSFDKGIDKKSIPVCKQNEIGKLVSAFNYLLQILDQREEALIKSMTKYSEIFDQSPIAIEWYDNAGFLISVNNAYFSLFGVIDRHEITKFDLFKDPNINRDVKKRLLNGESVRFEAEFSFEEVKRLKLYRTTCSGIKILDWLITPMKIDNVVVGYIEQIQDVTERKNAEVALLVSEEKYRSLIENNHDIIYTLDVDGIFDFVSPAWTKMLGHQVDQVEKHSFQEFVHDEDLPACLEWLKKVTETEQKQKSIEYRVRHIDGTWRWHASSAIQTKDINGKVYGYTGTARDITERKQLQKALIEAERLSAIGEMSSGVAHDFNNSLQIIIGNLEVALFDPSVPRETVELIEVAKKSANDAASRVQQVQRFAQVNKETNYSSININTLLDQAVCQSKPLWRDEAQKRGLQISFQKSYGKLVVIDGEEGELSSALYNIIKNAIEAMPNGGEVIIETGIVEKKVFIRLSDNGIGMSEDTKLRIFQPFFSTKGFKLGKGLGMSGAYSIIRDHGGSIAVINTALGKGTTIEILLPVGELKKEQVAEVLFNSNDLTSARVLWVDDEESIREMGKMFMKRLGHSASFAGSGIEAIEILKNNQYDWQVPHILDTYSVK